MDPVDFWGRSDRPFYGGAVGTHATLSLLAELGMPRTAQMDAACENLLDNGQHRSGGFTYDGTAGRRVLCYNGNAIRTLIHFGYLGDERVDRAFDYLVALAVAPDGMTCPYSNGGVCQWGIAKVLAGFAALPATERYSARQGAVKCFADAVLDYQFDFAGRDARWLRFGFPLDYQSDLVELCDALARLGYGADYRHRRLLDLVVDAQLPDGRWIKQYGTRALRFENRGEPSKWLTIRAMRALKHTSRVLRDVERPRLRGERCD
jgi:hypothetical protein